MGAEVLVVSKRQQLAFSFSEMSLLLWETLARLREMLLVGWLGVVMRYS